MKKKGGLLWIPGTEGVSLKDAIKSDAGKEFVSDVGDIAEKKLDEKYGDKPKTQGSPEEERLLKNLNDLAEKYKGGRRKTKKLRRKFDKCVRAVRKTVKARKGSTKKQAAYAICTKTILSK